MTKNNKNIAVGVMALFLVAFALVGIKFLPTVSTPNVFAGVSSPDVPSPYFSFGGVRLWAGMTQTLAQATTTVCAIQSPSATSSLQSAGIRFDTSSTTASIVTIAKATTQYATTTSLGVCNLLANTQATCIASTTPTTSQDPIQVFAPNTWLVVGMAGGTGTFSPAGNCHATWEAYTF